MRQATEGQNRTRSKQRGSGGRECTKQMRRDDWGDAFGGCGGGGAAAVGAKGSGSGGTAAKHLVSDGHGQKVTADVPTRSHFVQPVAAATSQSNTTIRQPSHRTTHIHPISTAFCAHSSHSSRLPSHLALLPSQTLPTLVPACAVLLPACDRLVTPSHLMV